jgi:ATP-dependent Lon protease
MSKVPLFIISTDDTVPLPGGTYVLDVQAEHLHLFSCVEVNKIEYIALGLADCENPIPLLENSSHPLDPLLRVGVMCKIIEREPTENFTVFTLKVLHRVLVRGLQRSATEDDPYTLWLTEEPVTEEFLTDEEELSRDIDDMINILVEKDIWRGNGQQVVKELQENGHLLQKMNIMGENILHGKDRLRFLQELGNFDRWNIVVGAISKLAESKIKKNRKAVPPPTVSNRSFNSKVNTNYEKNKKPLTWREKVDAANLPEEVHEKILADLIKLENTPKNSTEYAQAADYLRWIVSIPWGKTSYVPADLKKLHSILNETHYGLDEVKEHLLEIMCVQELQGGSAGTVLCFIGPPGTGKTTIAKAIADVSNRPLIRIALGGLSDTAELRG